MKRLALALTLIAGSTIAQGQDAPVNPFYGFDFLIQPLAFKWSCGASADADLAHIQTLIKALPEEAERGGVQIYIDAIYAISQADDGFTQLAGGSVATADRAGLCHAAKRLNIEWLTPAHLRNEVDFPAAETPAWTGFYAMAETVIGGL